jgi:hypothetical protein
LRLQISPDFFARPFLFCHLTKFHQEKRAALQIPLKEGIVGEREGDLVDNYIYWLSVRISNSYMLICEKPFRG